MCVCVCARACVRACVRVCVCVCVLAIAPARVQSCKNNTRKRCVPHVKKASWLHSLMITLPSLPVRTKKNEPTSPTPSPSASCRRSFQLQGDAAHNHGSDSSSESRQSADLSICHLVPGPPALSGLERSRQNGELSSWVLLTQQQIIPKRSGRKESTDVFCCFFLFEFTSSTTHSSQSFCCSLFHLFFFYFNLFNLCDRPGINYLKMITISLSNLSVSGSSLQIPVTMYFCKKNHVYMGMESVGRIKLISYSTRCSTDHSQI